MPYSRGPVSTPSDPVLVQDEGIDLIRRQTINFAGAGVTAVDSGGKTVVTIDGSGSLFRSPTNAAYGAIGNGVADDTTAVQACLNAGHGIVFVPPGIYKLTSLVTIPAGVSVWGTGSAQNLSDASVIFRCAASGAGLSFIADGGLHQNFYIDGNNIGTQPFRRLTSNSGGCFINIDVRFSAQDGGWWKSAQNDAYYNCRFQSSGRYGGVWDDGTGGHNYFGGDFSASGSNDAKFQETVNTGGYNYPTDIKFWGTRFEYVAANVPVIYHGQGERLTFWNGLVGQRFGSFASGIFYQEDNATGEVTLEAMQWTGAALSGQSAVRAGNNTTQPLVVRGQHYFNALSYAIDLSANSHKCFVWNVETWTFGGGVGIFAPSSHNVQGWYYGPRATDGTCDMVALSASTNPTYRTFTFGDASYRWIMDGAGRQLWGSGSATGDVALSRKAADVLGLDAGDGLQLEEAGSDLPAGATNQARIYTKDNGGGKTQLCVRFATGAVQILATEP